MENSTIEPGRDDGAIDDAQVALFRSIASRITDEDSEQRFGVTLRNLLSTPKAKKLAKQSPDGLILIPDQAGGPAQSNGRTKHI
jgi:hypothetical protein